MENEKSKETIHIRLQGADVIRDQGAFLSGLYDSLSADVRTIGGNPRGSQPRLMFTIDNKGYSNDQANFTIIS